MAVIRMSCRDGQFRSKVNPSKDTITELLKEISKKNGISPENMLAYRDKSYKQRLDPNATIQNSKLNHGDIIYVKYDTEKHKSFQDIEAEKEEERRKKALENTDAHNLHLGLRKRHWRMDEFLSLLDKHTIHVKHQDDPTCGACYLDTGAAQKFQAYLAAMAFQVQRMGYLYGRLEEEVPSEDGDDEEWDPEEEEDITFSPYVDVIYEPPQDGNSKECLELDDPLAERVDLLTSLLGLRKIGWIFSAPADREYELSGPEVLKAAKLQSVYGNDFITVKVGTREDGKTQMEAFQVSKQCVDLYKDGFFEEHEDSKMLKTRKPIHVEKKETDEVDCAFFVTAVPIKEGISPFKTQFPIENRPYAEKTPSIQTLKEVLEANRSKPFVERVSDFHMLFFLCDFLGLDQQMIGLCDAVKEKNNTLAKEYEPIISNYTAML
eukprot:gb/GECH01013753.1/.p1 GENE.gb/GECH01013753.1/~~gb/GECH01013753.1/.p1  ORF type:complete len:435 (+),score=136.54 gb/GECH01013753.1/:1-1305(+)